LARCFARWGDLLCSSAGVAFCRFLNARSAVAFLFFSGKLRFWEWGFLHMGFGMGLNCCALAGCWWSPWHTSGRGMTSRSCLSITNGTGWQPVLRFWSTGVSIGQLRACCVPYWWGNEKKSRVESRELRVGERDRSWAMGLGKRMAVSLFLQHISFFRNKIFDDFFSIQQQVVEWRLGAYSPRSGRGDFGPPRAIYVHAYIISTGIRNARQVFGHP
jgi:hypothetical protein